VESVPGSVPLGPLVRLQLASVPLVMTIRRRNSTPPTRRTMPRQPPVVVIVSFGRTSAARKAIAVPRQFVEIVTIRQVEAYDDGKELRAEDVMA
jgi:hypothetical protein